MDLKEIVTSQTDPDVFFAVRSAMSIDAPIIGYLKASVTSGKFYVIVDSSDKDTLGRPAGTGSYYRVYNASLYGLPEDSFVAISSSDKRIYTTALTTDSDMNKTTPKPDRTTESYSMGGTITNTTATQSVNIQIDQYADQQTVLNMDYTENDRLLLRNETMRYNRASTSYDYARIKDNMLTAFDRFRMGAPDQKLAKAFPRVFFTRPDLNFFSDENVIRSSRNAYNTPTKLGGTVTVNDKTVDHSSEKVANDTWYAHTYKTDPMLLASLTNIFSNLHIFNPFLSNAASSFDISDEKLETIEHGETFTGWKIKLGRHNIGTKTAGSFSVTYDETNRLEVYKIHKAWVDYISKVYKGEFYAKDDYIKDRRLDYACSVYYFLCAEDGETVLFWSRYTGVFPTSIPASQFAWNKNDIVRHTEPTVEYDYAWKEDCDYAILQDFNYNPYIDTSTMDVSANTLSTYDPSLGHAGFTFANRPIIVLEPDEDGTPNSIIKLKYVGQPEY